jgi:hypothetical protein
VLVFFRDPDAGVAHRELDRVAARRELERDFAALGELERVRQQVLEDLRQPL